MDLSGKAFTPTHVCDNPLIFAGCVVKRPKAKPSRSKATSATSLIESTEHKCELLIRDLWKNETNSSHEVRVMNTEDKYHSAKTPEKSLQEAERSKNKMYLEACLQKRRHFLPFEASVDGLLGV